MSDFLFCGRVSVLRLKFGSIKTTIDMMSSLWIGFDNLILQEAHLFPKL